MFHAEPTKTLCSLFFACRFVSPVSDHRALICSRLLHYTYGGANLGEANLGESMAGPCFPPRAFNMSCADVKLHLSTKPRQQRAKKQAWPVVLKGLCYVCVCAHVFRVQRPFQTECLWEASGSKNAFLSVAVGSRKESAPASSGYRIRPQLPFLLNVCIRFGQDCR